jgi:hypothetical protein
MRIALQGRFKTCRLPTVLEGTAPTALAQLVFVEAREEISNFNIESVRELV